MKPFASPGASLGAALGLIGLAALACCTRQPVPNPRYEVGQSYQINGFWYYPAENYNLTDTGLAAVFDGRHAPLTSNGEVFDQSAVMAAHPTLQLPAIARLTDLENGRSLLVRINDRGTGSPRRLIEVTRRTATLLGMPAAGATRVRLEVLAVESRAAAEGLAGVPSLALTAAPRDAVRTAPLAPPPGVREETGRTVVSPGVPVPDTAMATAAPVRLPETVTQGSPLPGRLWVRLDTFEEYQYAAVQRARVGYLGAGIDSSYNGRTHRFWVRIGPLDTVRQAEDALDAARAAGIPDAHIVVE